MSTPPPALAPGVERSTIKARIESAVLAYLNPGADLKSWKVSRYHFDDFTSDTDAQVALSFVVGIGASRYDSDRQRIENTGRRATYMSTEVRVKLATRGRAPNMRADSTKHLAWSDAVLRGVMTAQPSTGLTLIYRNSNPSVSLQAGQVLVSEHVIDARHVLPLE